MSIKKLSLSIALGIILAQIIMFGLNVVMAIVLGLLRGGVSI